MSGIEVVAAWMAAAGAAAGVASSVVQAKNAEDQMAREALILRDKKEQIFAAAQLDALQQDKRTKLIASRALALSAASGSAGSLTDDKIISDINSEGAYRKSIALYQGESGSYDLEEKAKAAEYKGYAAQTAAKAKQVSSVLSLAGSGYKAYGGYANYRDTNNSEIDFSFAGRD